MDKQTASASKKSSRPRKTSARDNGSSTVNTADSSNLEQVRDLLFGNDLAQLRSQLMQLDDRFNKAMQTLEKNIAAQFKKQTQATLSLKTTLEASLKKESDQRAAGLDKLKHDIQSLNKTTQQTMQQAAGDAAAAEEKLRNELSLLESGTEQAINEINDKLENTETLLDGNKTDRTLLASLFKSMANDIEKGRQ